MLEGFEFVGLVSPTDLREAKVITGQQPNRCHQILDPVELDPKSISPALFK